MKTISFCFVLVLFMFAHSRLRADEIASTPSAVESVDVSDRSPEETQPSSGVESAEAAEVSENSPGETQPTSGAESMDVSENSQAAQPQAQSQAQSTSGSGPIHASQPYASRSVKQAPVQASTAFRPKLELTGKRIMLGDEQVKTSTRMREIFKEYGATEALAIYNQSKGIGGLGMVFSLIGGGLVGASVGMLPFKGYRTVNTYLFSIGGGLIVTALLLVIPSSRLLKKAVKAFNGGLAWGNGRSRLALGRNAGVGLPVKYEIAEQF